MKNRNIIYVVIIILIMTTLCNVKCDSNLMPPPKVGSNNWKPKSLGGPIELRNIPPANMIINDYENWIDSESIDKARVYEMKLCGATNQSKFVLKVENERTPLGNAEHTYVTFVYNDMKNGSYELNWHRLGRHTADFLKVTEVPVTVWVTFDYSLAKNEGKICLNIVALEGVELGGYVMATSEKKRK